ncbi:MAG: C-terminal target protein [Flavipsychrobacter sp.]|nr:C-terminal target protein [Flavipsychrobacter sp.]
MIKKIFFACCTLILVSTSIYAAGYGACSHKKDKKAAKTTLADPGEDEYDLKYLKFNLHVTDTSVYLWGDVTTTAQVVASSMTNYVFELDTLMVVDSALVNGTLYPVTNTSNVRTITLSTPLPAGSSFTAQIFYHGVPPPGGGFFNGLTHSISGAGTHMLYTVSDPWVAMVWWPTKQSVNDQIDSVDMFITVPQDVVDGSNGVLVDVDKVSNPGFWTYHWQTHYPIDYYLISIAVAKFGEYKSYMHFTGSPDSMLIQNFFIDTTSFNPAYKANFDSLDQFINYFSSVYGRYPFWKEKYGVCFTTLPGGMEHQTMTTIGVPYTYIIAHELAHQWWGDHVTYRTWGDVWLSEGFATFSEQLFLSHFWGEPAAKAHRLAYLNNIFSAPCGQLHVSDTSGSNTLFDGATVYAKGQGVVTMLRYIAPTDSQFFQVLQNYQQTYSFGNASTADLKAIAESVYGFNLGTFFNQWIYGRGFPQYRMTWNQSGSTVFVRLQQTTSCPDSTAHFSTPLELQLHATTGDTIIKVYNTLDNEVFSFNWDQSISTVYLNPDAYTICKLLGTVKQDTTLGFGNILPYPINIYPNPTKNFWHIDQIPAHTALTLTDMKGNVVWRGTSNNSTACVPGTNLPAGNYVLNLEGASFKESVKLVHW